MCDRAKTVASFVPIMMSISVMRVAFLGTLLHGTHAFSIVSSTPSFSFDGNLSVRSSWRTRQQVNSLTLFERLDMAHGTSPVEEAKNKSNSHNACNNGDDMVIRSSIKSSHNQDWSMFSKMSPMTPSSSSSSSTTAMSSQIPEVPTTWSQAWQVFLASSSYHGPRIVVILLMCAMAARVVMAPLWSWLDTVVVVVTFLFWCIQEHVLHGHLLHSQMNWLGKQIHENHHAQPYHHISIDPSWLMVTWMGAVYGILSYVMPTQSLALTATIAYALAGLWYEFLHFIVHTRIRFRRGSYFQIMKDHHARHHLIDNRYWLGFSLPLVDDLMGTNPSVAQVRKMKQQQQQRDAA